MSKFYESRKLKYNIIGIAPSLNNMGLAVLRPGVLNKNMEDGLTIKEMFDDDIINHRSRHSPIEYVTFTRKSESDLFQRARLQVEDAADWIDWENFEFTSYHGTPRGRDEFRANRDINREKWMTPIEKTIAIIERPRYVGSKKHSNKYTYILGLLQGTLVRPFTPCDIMIHILPAKLLTKKEARIRLAIEYPEIRFAFNEMNDYEIGAFMCISQYLNTNN